MIGVLGAVSKDTETWLAEIGVKCCQQVIQKLSLMRIVIIIIIIIIIVIIIVIIIIIIIIIINKAIVGIRTLEKSGDRMKHLSRFSDSAFRNLNVR